MMIELGEYHTLTIARETPQGFYLENDEGHEVLLPGVYRRRNMAIGDDLTVFVYGDSENRPVATTELPLLTVNTAAYLTVTDVNDFGAFCHWGLPKELFVPFRNQSYPLKVGQSVVVYMYFDRASQRLVGTVNLKGFFKDQIDEGLDKGQEVSMLVANRTDLGYRVILNQAYFGLVYDNEAEDLAIGETRKGYIKPLRPDGKIDVSLHPIGVASIEPNAKKILFLLKQHDGFLPLSDQSDPQTIRDELGMSKKLFKKAVGALYRQRLIVLEDEGIRLRQDASA
jgi:hypothetical protein